MQFKSKKAMIYDLDNTLYPVHAIGEELFAPLFQLIQQYGDTHLEMGHIKKDIMRKPFQEVAEKYNFNDQLKVRGLELLNKLTYDKKIDTFEDYPAILEIPGERYLVTTGFTNMQNSKINLLGVKKDFTKTYVVDPTKSDSTKKDIFEQIMIENKLQPDEMMVIGDDPDSEIKAAEALGIETVLYHKLELAENPHADHIIKDFRELVSILIT